MKQISIISRVLSLSVALGLAATLLPQKLSATPYATSLTNNSGVISFRLNEAANSVAVIFTNLSGTLVTSNLGARTLGLTVTNLFVPGNFTVSVTNSANPGYVSGTVLQVTADGTNGTSTNTLRFNAPRGVAVNKNPSSPFFGRIYVANSTIGTTSTRTNVGDGIFVLSADYSDVLGQGTNALRAGITAFTNAVAASTDDGNTPWRLEIGEDNNLYISDFSISNGNIFVTDPNVSVGTNVLAGFGIGANASPNHGRIGSSVIAKGSLANSNLVLYAIDSDNAATSDGNPNHIKKWDVGAGPLPVDLATGTIVTNIDNGFLLPNVGVTVDLTMGLDGKFFMMQNRSDGNEDGVLVVDPLDDSGASGFSAGGDGLADVVFASRIKSINSFGATNDLLRLTRAGAISPDGKYLALVRDDNAFWVIQLVGGVPDLSTRKLVTTSSAVSIGRDITFDAAGNIYTVSSGQAVMRAYAPGYKSVTQTSSQGTFTVTNILPGNTVTVTATDPTATEDINFPNGLGGDSGMFSFTRDGDATSPLTVNYAVTGTAARGADYATNGLSGAIPVINGVITFAAGETTTNVTIAVQDDALGEAPETVIFTVTASTNYLVGGTGTATVTIADDGDLPAITITNLGGSYSLLPSRPAKFRLTTPIAYASDLVINISLSGTAVSGVDYTNPSTFSVTLLAGIVATNFTVTPYGNSLTNAKTIIATVLTGVGGYTNTPATATATNILRPDYLVPTTTLFAENFDTDVSASWTTRTVAGTNNSDATFAYDYSVIGVPVAPHTTNGTTRGLRLRSHLAGAVTDAISTSPTGKAFTNDFRMRFDLWMNYNGPLPGGGTGSSEYFTVGVGVSETRTNVGASATSLPGSSVIFAASGDGGFSESAGDYIVTTNGVLTVSNSVAIYPAASRDNNNIYYAEFGEIPAPAAQVALYPTPAAGANQTGLGAIGSLSFSWHDVVITKIGSVYTWTIDGLKMASVDYGTTTVGTNISFGYQDTTTSLMDNVLMNNAIVDNLIVEKLISTNALLANLVISSTTLSPAFAAGTGSYAATNAFVASPVTVTATAAGGSSASLRLSLNGGSLVTLTNGVASIPQTLSLSPNTNTLSVRVVSEDGLNTNFYTTVVKLLPSQTSPVLTNSYNGSAVTFTWPSSHIGYRLLTQTNSLAAGLGTNWLPVASSDLTNKVVIPVNPANPTVFYKLVYP